MFKTHFASLLVCTVTLLSITSSNVFAQSFTHAGYAKLESNSTESKTKSTLDLKAALDREMAKIKAESSTTAFKRMQEKEQNPQPSAKPKGAFTKGEKRFLIGFIIGVTVLVAFVIAKGVDNPRPLCSDNPNNDPNCI